MATDKEFAPSSTDKKSYLLYLFDSEQMKLGWCVVQAEHPDGMQEFMTDTAKANGGLIVHDHDGNKFTMHHPEVIKIDDKTAAHLPIVESATN